MNTPIDAKGLSCPQPVIVTRRALEEAGSGTVTILVDTMTHVQNCTRAARQLGWEADHEDKGDEFVLTFRK